MSPLHAISPIDGRYAGKVSELSPYFSEFGLIRYRVLVEIRYLQALYREGLPQVTKVDEDSVRSLTSIIESFGDEDAEAIKQTERVTNHDVKAVEYYVKEKMRARGLEPILEFVHFGLTSQDINNTAIPLSLKAGLEEVLLPNFVKLLEKLEGLAEEWRAIAMLARTHGQPASPTLLGKEIRVFTVRLRGQLDQLAAVPHAAKFGGATGNLNAHYAAFPDRDWHAFAKRFVEDDLGLSRSYPTTQIEHYDNLAALFHALSRTCTILIDLCRDLWTYISMEYFRQRTVAGEIGSSAMPHKVNPIDFENSEGNLGIANALFEHFSAKLPVSRLQRDLTDSTVLRNIGVPIAHQVIALHSLLKGLGKLELNEQAIRADLDANWVVVSEAIQTVLRREGYPKPYEALKELTRTNERVTHDTIARFVETLDVSEAVKEELRRITPFNYLGVVESD